MYPTESRLQPDVKLSTLQVLASVYCAALNAAQCFALSSVSKAVILYVLYTTETTESRLQPDVNIVRIARSSSSTGSVSRRVAPTEPDISRFRGTTFRKVDPAVCDVPR